MRCGPAPRLRLHLVSSHEQTDLWPSPKGLHPIARFPPWTGLSARFVPPPPSQPETVHLAVSLARCFSLLARCPCLRRAQELKVGASGRLPSCPSSRAAETPELPSPALAAPTNA